MCVFVCVCALCVLCMEMKCVGGTRANRSEVCVVVCCGMLQGAARHCSVLQRLDERSWWYTPSAAASGRHGQK